MAHELVRDEESRRDRVFRHAFVAALNSHRVGKRRSFNRRLVNVHDVIAQQPEVS